MTLSYDPSYEKLAYPMGDVDIKKGVCTDVVVGRYVIRIWICKGSFLKI